METTRQFTIDLTITTEESETEAAVLAAMVAVCQQAFAMASILSTVCPPRVTLTYASTFEGRVEQEITRGPDDDED